MSDGNNKFAVVSNFYFNDKNEMSLIVINELGNIGIPDADIFDISGLNINDCTGCWSCWWKTPGRCAFTDLDEFYNKYITADKAIYLAKVTRGFVSGNLKTLFDRMIPLYLPYTTYKTGESMHVTRYDKYPEIEFYYDGELAGDSLRVFTDYIHRVFYQFYSKLTLIEHISKYTNRGGQV